MRRNHGIQCHRWKDEKQGNGQQSKEEWKKEKECFRRKKKKVDYRWCEV